MEKCFVAHNRSAVRVLPQERSVDQSNRLSIINLSGCHWSQKSPFLTSFQHDRAAAPLGHPRPGKSFKPSCCRGGPRSVKRRCAPRVRGDSAAPRKTIASNLERSCARASIETLRQANQNNYVKTRTNANKSALNSVG